MTNDEIRTSYRDAAHKSNQIRILSHLTMRPVDEIRYVLGLRPDTGKRKFDRVKAMELYKKGLIDQKIADKLGVSKSTIAKWRYEQDLEANSNRPRLDEELALKLYKRGWVDEQIGRETGFSNATIWAWRKKRGLPTQADRKVRQ